jgi:hypothetical protein
MQTSYVLLLLLGGGKDERGVGGGLDWVKARKGRKESDCVSYWVLARPCVRKERPPSSATHVLGLVNSDRLEV